MGKVIEFRRPSRIQKTPTPPVSNKRRIVDDARLLSETMMTVGDHITKMDVCLKTVSDILETAQTRLERIKSLHIAVMAAIEVIECGNDISARQTQ